MNVNTKPSGLTRQFIVIRRKTNVDRECIKLPEMGSHLDCINGTTEVMYIIIKPVSTKNAAKGL